MGRIDYDITEALERAEGRRWWHIDLPTIEELGYIILFIAGVTPLVALVFD